MAPSSGNVGQQAEYCELAGPWHKKVRSSAMEKGYGTDRTQRAEEGTASARSSVKAGGAPRSDLRVSLRKGRQKCSDGIGNGKVMDKKKDEDMAVALRGLQQTPESMRVVENNEWRRVTRHLRSGREAVIWE